MFEAHLYAEHRLLVIKITGELCLEHFMEFYAPYIEQANIEHVGPDAPNRIYDVRKLKLNISTDQVRDMSDWVNSLNSAIGHCQSAFLTESDLMYGLLRQFVEFGKDSTIARAVFRDPREALGWLGVNPKFAPELGLGA